MSREGRGRVDTCERGMVGCVFALQRCQKRELKNGKENSQRREKWVY